MAEDAIDKSALDYQEPNTTPTIRREISLEDLWSYLPRVNAEPSWLPRKFYESLALDETNNQVWYWDFSNNQWRSVDKISLAAGTGITITPSGQTYTISTTQPSQLIKSFEAGENISSKDAVVIGTSPTSATTSVFTGYGITQDLSNVAFPTNNGLIAQTFTATYGYLHKVECQVDQEDLSNMTLELQVQTTSGGAPSGTAVGSPASYSYDDTVDNSGSRHQSVAVFDFSSNPIPLTPSSVYALVMRYSSSDHASDPPRWAYSNGFGYSGGAMYTHPSGSWTAPNGGANDMSFKTYESSSVGGKIFKADASNNDDLANNFIGFADAAITSGQTGNVVISGVVTGMSGISSGLTYYLSDTSGAISSTAGTQSRKIGKAISDTELLIKHDNT